MPNHIYQNPNQYSQNNALQYNFAMKLVSKISFNSQSRVLDIGCGDGAITNDIAAIVTDGYVLGTDISDSMIEFASQKYKDRNNLRFVTMDASQIIFREQFDIITSFNCLHWVKDQQAALSGIVKVAVPGAQIALLLSHKKSSYHFALDNICSNIKWKDYFVEFICPRLFYGRDEYKSLLLKSGLQLLELNEVEMTYTFESKEQVKDFFSAAGAQIKIIPDNKKEDFLNDFITEYLKITHYTPNNLIPVSFWCLQVVASKPKV